MRSIHRWTAMSVLLLAHFCQGADPLDTWNWRNPLPVADSQSVTYLIGEFIAFGNGGLLTSPDGITWTKRSTGATSIIDFPTFGSIVYGNGLFLAVGVASGASGGTNCFVTSTDGVNWTPTIISGAPITRVAAYGSGLFVGLGTLPGVPGSLYTSPDGTNWTEVSSETEINGVTYGNGLFVGVSYDQSAIYTSVNGDSWKQVNVEISAAISGVYYGNGHFVIPYGSSGVLTSPDGTNWSLRATTLSPSSFFNGEFLGGGTAFVSSPDAINWTESPPYATNPPGAAVNGVDTGLFESGGASSVAWGNGLFVAAAANTSGQIASSPDGTNWTKRTSGVPMQSLNGLAYGDGRYVAVGTSLWDGITIASPILTSPDGITWTAARDTTDVGGDVSGGAVAYGNGLFVAVGSFLRTSPDGINWTSVSFGENFFYLSDIIFANGRFLACGFGLSGYGGG